MNIKPIPGYPGYFISDEGIAYSERNWRKQLVPLTPTLNDDGYQEIKISAEHSRKGKTRLKIHQLVLKAFGGISLFPQLEARHLNGVRTDNRIENLAWGTKKQNSEDAEAHGTIAKGEDKINHKLSEPEVARIRNLHDSGLGYGMIAQAFGVNRHTVRNVVKRRTWKHV